MLGDDKDTDYYFFCFAKVEPTTMKNKHQNERKTPLSSGQAEKKKPERAELKTKEGGQPLEAIKYQDCDLFGHELAHT